MKSYSKVLKVLAGAAIALPMIGCATDPGDANPTRPALEEEHEVAFPDLDGEEIPVELPFESGVVRTTGRVVDEERVVVMGDVVLRRDQVDPAMGGARATQVTLGRRWPNAQVVYDVQGGSDARVTGAIGIWAQQTNLTFKYRTNESAYIHVELGASGTGCYSDAIGRTGGYQIIHLAPECSQGNAIHEFGHTIGLSHEQSRTDRDSYITVDTSQIQTSPTDRRPQFNKIDGSTASNFGWFDFGSVMMYDSYAFASGSKPTMKKLDGTTWTSQRSGLSDQDRGSIWYQYRQSNTSAIRGLYDQVGGLGSFLGFPVTGEYQCPDGVGWYVQFSDNGSIYYSPQTGTHTVHGAIRNLWASFGWERSFLGYPTTDETLVPNGTGFYNHFQYGSIYWSQASGAHAIYGLIRDKWAQLGWETSTLGYPTTDETGTPDGVGRYNHFQRGSIYWTPATGAVKVDGAIRDLWASKGWETSCLGYPTADASAMFTIGGRYLGIKQTFQRGEIRAYDGSAPYASCN